LRRLAADSCRYFRGAEVPAEDRVLRISADIENTIPASRGHHRNSILGEKIFPEMTEILAAREEHAVSLK
jgi:hypothetical protein